MSHKCEACSQVFKTKEEYDEHRVDHMMGRVPDKDVDEMIDRGTEEQKHDEIMAEPIVEEAPLGKVPPTATQTHAEKPWVKKEKIPIKLVYKYEGSCEKCEGELDTLEIDAVAEKGKIVVVGWCNACKKQVRQRTVIKL